MNEGWIKILRKFLDWEWFQKPEMVQLFIYLLLKANYEQKQWQGITILPGQLVTSRTKICSETKLSEQTVRTCIKRLISTNEITYKSTNRYILITICKYESYQLENEFINQQNNQQTNFQSTSNQPATNFQSTTTKELKKERKKEEYNILSPKEDNIPSTPEAVEASNAKKSSISALPFKKITDLWNDTCSSYAKILKLSESRQNKIRIRVEEMGGIEKALPVLQQIFINVQNSLFLKGQNSRGWKASFDWLFENDKNWVKVFEGNYNNDKNYKNASITKSGDSNSGEKIGNQPNADAAGIKELINSVRIG